MARYEVPEGYTVALIATMPRSGTWLSFHVLEFLDFYLSGRTRLDLEVYHALPPRRHYEVETHGAVVMKRRQKS